ncbi:MAG: phage tail protein [Synechococcaceae cyanobacterium]|jgi:phage tail-like protein
MAMTVGQQAREHPLVVYNYRVIVDSIAMRFSKVEGLVWERSAITYRDGWSFLDGEMISTYRVDHYAPITLQQGLISRDTQLLDWLKKGDARMLQVLLCKSDGEAILSWKAQRAYPIRLTPTTLDASSNEVAIDTLELQARGWSLNHPL